MDRVEFVAGTYQVFKEYLVDCEGNPIKPTIVQNVEFMLSKYGESEIQCYIELNHPNGGYITLDDDFVTITLNGDDTKYLDGLYDVRLRITDMSNRTFETEVHKVLIKKYFHR